MKSSFSVFQHVCLSYRFLMSSYPMSFLLIFKITVYLEFRNHVMPWQYMKIYRKYKNYSLLLINIEGNILITSMICYTLFLHDIFYSGYIN